MQTNLQKILIQVIKENYNIVLNEIKLDTPPKKELWDFAFWVFVLSKELKKNPNEIAENLAKILNNLPEIEFANEFWPYVNIRLNKNIFTQKFLEIYKDDLETKFHYHWRWQKIIVDYIGANVWKPFHIGHMCTPNQGQAIINVYKKLGYNVISDSHIWDWWIIFGKLILAYKMWWDEKKLQSNAVDYLFELYVKVSAYIEEVGEEWEQKTRDEFKLLSRWNKEAIEYWENFTKYSIENLNKELARLKVKPDYNIWESFYEGLNLPKIEDYPDLKDDMNSIVEELLKAKIATKNDDGSVWVVFPESSKLPSCILQKKDWTNLYLTSDLACVKYRMQNWNPSKIIYFVDVRQQLHLQQVFEISRLAGWLLRTKDYQKIHWDVEDKGLIKNYELKDDNKETELFHAYNWFISLKDGAMSTRKWRIIRLEDLLNEAEKRAKDILKTRENISEEELDKLARIIWIWAIKYGYLKKSRENDVIFDWDEFMAFEWNSWPYIQYSYVRAKRILDKIGIKNFQASVVNSQFDTEDETNLVKLFLDYENVLLETAEKNMPHILCKYIYDLTKSFSTFYNNVRVLDEENEEKKVLKLMLVDYYAKFLKDSFSLLAIEMPERM